MTEEEADAAQDWKGMDGATAFLLIERHADGWNEVRQMMDAWLRANVAAAVLAEREAVRLNATVPDGWKLVPVEATDEMVKVGDQKTWVFPSRECWAAMLSAAPAAPQPAQQERKPLTESAIQQIGLDMPSLHHPGWLIEFARAIERAHGITED